MRLADLVSMHLAEWTDSPPYVELAIYGTADPAAIAAAVEDFCRRELGSGVASGLFHASSIGAVSGVVLGDGRRVVVKAHQPDWSPEHLAEIARVQQHLAERNLYASRVVVGPRPLGAGHALVEEYDEDGLPADAHDPRIRRALARSLHDIVAVCQPLVAGSTLPPLGLVGAPTLWPVPHSRLFAFSTPVPWIDDVARAARQRAVPAGDVVIGHHDWRAEHVRVDGDRVVRGFDWDSLNKDREPVLVGTVAHGFTADWAASPSIARAPTLDEARAFVAEYEDAARADPFDAAERRLCGAVFAYACAYTARCNFSGNDDRRDVPGTHQHLVASLGADLAEL